MARRESCDRATEVLHKKTRHLANLSPHEVAQSPSGDRIVFAELDNIVLQASHYPISSPTQRNRIAKDAADRDGIDARR
jgi:hypothetical protein